MALTSLFRSAAEPLQPIRHGIRTRPPVPGDGLPADGIVVDDGVAATPHAHELEQAAHQVSGQLAVALGDRRRRLAPGDADRIPAGTPHAVRCLRQGAYVLMAARGHPVGHDHHDHAH
jgi:quercetin dioxygenase-like cupin family protein